MSRNTNIYLNDIISSISQIKEYIEDYSFDNFSKDKRTIDAVIRNLEIIGEAVKSIPQTIKSKYKYEWRAVAGLKDILIHQYFGINLKIIWDIIQNELPQFEKLIKQIIQNKSFENNSKGR